MGGTKMTNTELAARIEEEITEEYGADASVFTGVEAKDVVTSLHEAEEIDWYLLDTPDTMACRPLPDQTGYVFYTNDEIDEISKDDLVDLILKIEDAYQVIKDKVNFND